MKRHSIAILLALAVVLAAQVAARGGTAGRVDPETLRTPLYTPEGPAFVRHNGDRFNNRPLYCNQTSAIVVAGDRPLVRFGNGSVLDGTFMAALLRGNQARWLHDWSDVTAKYRPDRMQWILKDGRFGATTVTLDAVPPAEGPGMALRLRVENAQAGDQLLWVCGGAVQQKVGMLGAWDVTTSGRQKILTRGFSPDDCRGNRVTIDGERFIVASHARAKTAAVGQCSVACRIGIADAEAWSDPLKLWANAAQKPAQDPSKATGKNAHPTAVVGRAFLPDRGSLGSEIAAKDKPLACGVVPVDGPREIYWTMVAFPSGKSASALHLPPAAEAFAAGLRRAEEIGVRVVVESPDPRLDALVAASNAVTDGVFRDGIFTHSGMRWGVPLLGWRTLFGGTVYGWHDRVMIQARSCLAKQITASDKKLPKASLPQGLSCQSLDSRLFGKGRVDVHQPWHYDMQTQFFDQLIHAWRWTGNAELEKLLRPALELHLEYLHDCFDPNDTGLYESYANTWPTDDQWYNGGGTAEETAYAYAGHQAALELARRAGDTAAVRRHEARLAQIRKSFLEKLWIPSKGYVGSYVEQGGHGRLHEDCWLYAIFCPIDAGLLDTRQAAQSLYYSEWGLERETMPYGGQRCWTSNWVPSFWSLREMWPGDNYHLALAYFQTGLADEGWNALRGTFPLMAFYGPVPGDLGHPNGGTDFNDCASMFCRAVVEGLFGYRPDYPNGTVTIAPQLPSQWDHASIKTPDFSLSVSAEMSVAFRSAKERGFRGAKGDNPTGLDSPTLSAGRSSYRIELARPAALDLRLPVRARRLAAVTVNGAASKWELLAGYGCSVAKIAVPKCKRVVVELNCQEPLPQYPAVALETRVGEKLDLSAKDAQTVEPAARSTDAGYHWVESLVQAGDAPQRRVFKVHLLDPKAEAALAGQALDKAPADARWRCLDLSRQCNGDIRTIFQQQYLSPRPETCSLRLATDGYSTWQMMLGSKHKAPTIDLARVPSLLDSASRLRTPQGVPFAWAGRDRNVALTSMWDNWPRQVVVPVSGKAEAIWLLVCGFTNPMQGRIANAELRMKYADGVVEKLELVPPLNFWSLCPFGGSDYDYRRDGFCLPKVPPATVQLGNNCRAILLNRRLRPDAALESVTLETFSQEVIIGLMGASLMNPK